MVWGSLFCPFFIMYLYKQHCYATLQDVANRYKSDPFQYFDSYITDAFVSGSNIVIHFNKGSDFVLTPPVCLTLGHDSTTQNFLSLEQATELGWGISVVLLVVWSVKMIRRTL